MLNQHRLWCLFVVSLCVSTANAADAAIEEIIVTAQKRTETQQEVAATFTVYGESNMQAAGWNNVEEIASTVPSIELIGSSKSRTSLFIRSIGTNKYDIGTEGSVGVFVDGIYVPRYSSLMQDLLDLERLEVLRGPQGTLYGRNTIGGAISLYTKPADYTWNKSIEAEVANEDSHSLALRASGPITENLLVSFGLADSERAGYRTDLNTGESDDEETTTARAKFTWVPNHNLEATFTVNYVDRVENALLAESYSPTNELFAVSPLIPQSVIDDIVEEQAQDYYTSNVNIPGGTELDSLSASLTVVWSDENLIFESNTGFRDEDLEEATDTDSLPLDIILGLADQTSETISQEFRIISEDGGAYTFNDKIEWLAGVYLYRDEAVRTDETVLGADSALAVFSMAPFFSEAPYELGWEVDLETTSWAVFAEAGYHITDEFQLTVGARFSRDTKEFTYTAFSDIQPAFLSAEDNFAFDDTLRFESTDPKVVLQWRPAFAPDFNAYLSYTQGYKSGGIQFIARREAVARDSFDKETLKATELGIKSRWLDHKLQLNAALYHYDYRDQQIDGIVAAGSATMVITDNAGASTIDGAELDLMYKPTPELLIQLSYAYSDAYFDEYLQPGGGDLSGERLPASPRHAAWISSEYNHLLKNSWEVSMRMDYSWRDDQVYQPDAVFEQEAYGVLNLGVWLTDPADALTLRAFCSNCTDERYTTKSTQLSPAHTIQATGDRRSYGVSARYRF